VKPDDDSGLCPWNRNESSTIKEEMVKSREGAGSEIKSESRISIGKIEQRHGLTVGLASNEWGLEPLLPPILGGKKPGKEESGSHIGRNRTRRGNKSGGRGRKGKRKLAEAGLRRWKKKEKGSSAQETKQLRGVSEEWRHR